MAADTLTIAAGLKAMGVDAPACKTVEQAKALADEFVVATTMPSDRIKLAVMALGLPPELEPRASRPSCSSERMARARQQSGLRWKFYKGSRGARTGWTAW